VTKKAAPKKTTASKARSKPEAQAAAAAEDSKPKRKYTRRSKKTPVAVPKYQGKQGSLLRKNREAAAPLSPREEVTYPTADLDYFKEIILQKIHDANEELYSIEERLKDGSSGEYSEDSTYSLHMADQGTDAMEREKAYLFAARERKFISHLTDALQRIKSGNYGICIVCGNLIEKGRLEAVPHARMCISCKQETKVR
jgi:RNA polymerase-binding protein DksA